MVKYLFFFSFLFLLISCDQQTIVYDSNNLSKHSSQLIEKAGVAHFLLQEDKLLYSIQSSMYSFVTVSEWYDDRTILYLTDENGESILYKFDIFSGDNEQFFKIAEPIIRVDANFDNSIFTIEVSTMSGESDLYFVDRNGKTVFKLADVGEDYKLYWNRFQKHELLIASLQFDYSIQLKHVDLNQKRRSNFEFDYYYLQWISENEFAYLKWDRYVPGYYAQLYTYNIESKLDQRFANDVISFFSFDDYLLTITVKNRGAKHSDYTFIDINSKKEVAFLEVPILHTYSEQWWIPNHVFDEKNGKFIFFEPNESGDVFQYSSGFKLISFNIDTAVKTEITTSDVNYPMKVSPDGRWLIFGYQLENLVDLKNKEVISLVYW